MKRNEIFPSGWIKASEDLVVDGVRTPKVLTIDHVEWSQFGPNTEKKRILHFRPTGDPTIDGKRLSLNQVNWSSVANIASQTPPDDDNWGGVTIELFPVMVHGPNGNVLGVRIREPQGQPAPITPHDSVASDNVTPF